LCSCHYYRPEFKWSKTVQTLNCLDFKP
jgi:hypothetical protein